MINAKINIIIRLYFFTLLLTVAMPIPTIGNTEKIHPQIVASFCQIIGHCKPALFI